MEKKTDASREEGAREPAWAGGTRPASAPVAETGQAPRWAADEPDGAPESERRPSPGGFRVSGRARPFELGPETSRRAGLTTSLSLAAAGLLVLSLVLPSTPSPGFQGGWRELGDVGGASFLAALSLLLLGTGLALSLSARARALWLAALGAMFLGLGLSFLFEDVLREIYRGHPALRLFVERPLLSAIALSSLLLPAGLLARSAGAALWAPRILGALGVLAVLALYEIVPVGGEGQGGLSVLIATLRDPASLQGDLVAAWLLLAPLALVPSVLLLFLPAGRLAPVAFLALAFQLAAMGALFALALHVAKPSHWLDALPALKSVAVLAAGVLLFPAALGESAARLLSGARASAEERDA